MVAKAIDARNVKKHNQDQKKQLKTFYVNVQQASVTGFSGGGQGKTGAPEGWQMKIIDTIFIRNETDLDLQALREKVDRTIKKSTEKFQRVYIRFECGRDSFIKGEIQFRIKKRVLI